MHPNKIFSEHDPSVLLDTIQSNPFGLIVVVDEDGRPKVSQAPVLVKVRGDVTFIQFHLARNNNVCKILLNSLNCLCIFTGPDAYISPDWYGVPDQVPTWNYLSVECEGDIRELKPDEFIDFLDALSTHFERQLLPKPVWTRSKMKDGMFEAMFNAIIGFELKVTGLRGTTKLNQNKPASARKKVIESLKGNPITLEMKKLL